ncbi:MAG: hypothetical protein GY696_00955 [Gammaproteobacteria bacterium]|nr:hypothetical protein [Gammaproteobacteria bacterium]
MYRARPPSMSVLELRAVQRVRAERIKLTQGTAILVMWKGLELENPPWIPYPVNRSQRRQGRASSLGKPATAHQLACGKSRTRVGAGSVTHPHQHHRDDVPSPPELAQTYVGFQPLPGADVQPRAAGEQEEELPEDPEPLRAEGPLQEEKTQLPQPQISTLGCPTGLVFTHKVKSTITVSTRPCHNERRLLPFQEGNSPPPFSPGVRVRFT